MEAPSRCLLDQVAPSVKAVNDDDKELREHCREFICIIAEISTVIYAIHRMAWTEAYRC